VAWWQITLIVVGAVVVGLAVGYLFSILISGVIPAFVRKGKTEKKAPEKKVKPPSVHSPVISDTLSKLIAEIEYNRRLSSSEWTGELQPFQTNAWDNQGEDIHSLPAEVRNELSEAYSDMALANSITWLSIEMKRRSPSLDESYTRLRSSISERLNRAKPQLESNGLTLRSNPAQKN
jgi:hypothetical protein